MTVCSKFYVRSFKAKNRVLEFNYQKMTSFESVRCSKTDAQVSSRSVFLKMLMVLLGFMIDVHSLKAKNKVSELDYQKMNTLEIVRCSKNHV